MASKSALKSVNHSIFQFMKKHKDEMSFESRYGMTKRLTSMAKELHEAGFVVRHIKGLKHKHVETLVKHWQSKNLSSGTIKNRLADIRYICNEQGRKNAIKANDEYGIEKRNYSPTENKAIFNADFSQIKDEHLKISLELQQAFGLRREECLKIMPSLADKGEHLWLKDTWTKGKIERLIPITSEKQREILNKAKNFVNKNESLIPQNKSYIQQRHLYNRETRELGFSKLHGLRHAYAQKRYFEITGLKPPIKEGKKTSQMNIKEKKVDQIARKIISNELGHSRKSIAKIYLG